MANLATIINGENESYKDYLANVKEKVKPIVQIVDTKSAPASAATVKLVPVTDLLNTPSYCVIGAQTISDTQIDEQGDAISVNRTVGGVQLPADVNISPDFEKFIVLDNILDGSPVTEYVGRKATQLTITATFRAYYTAPEVNALDLSPNMFAQDLIEQFFQNAWQPNGSVSIQNSILNGLGITSIVINKMTLKFINGSTNVQLNLHCYEDVAGANLILS
jgi:Domain of unknown function (DUF6046)